MVAVSRAGVWMSRREPVATATAVAGVLGALLLAGLDQAWWLRAMAASFLAAAWFVCSLVALLLLFPAEYPSAALAATVAAVSGAAWFLVRPPVRDGRRP